MADHMIPVNSYKLYSKCSCKGNSILIHINNISSSLSIFFDLFAGEQTALKDISLLLNTRDQS